MNDRDGETGSARVFQDFLDLLLKFLDGLCRLGRFFLLGLFFLAGATRHTETKDKKRGEGSHLVGLCAEEK